MILFEAIGNQILQTQKGKRLEITDIESKFKTFEILKSEPAQFLKHSLVPKLKMELR